MGIVYRLLSAEVGISMSQKDRTGNLFPILLIVLLTGVVFVNGTVNGFVADDHGFIKNNPNIRSLKNTPSFFFSPEAMAGPEREWGVIIYRPLRTLSYALDYQFYGFGSTGYHVTSLLFHILVAITLYYLMFRLFNNRTVSLLGAVIFSIHPVHVEAVSWVASRADLIGLLFFNLSLLSYLSYRDHPRRIHYLVFSLFFSFLAYLGKETMIPLPGIIILFDYAFQRQGSIRKNLRHYLPAWMLFALICLAYLVLRFSITGRMSTNQGWWGGSPYSNFLMMGKVTAEYLRLLVFPFNLNLHYVIEPVHTVFDPKVLLSFVIILFSLAGIVYAYQKNKIVFFLTGWFYLALVPIANIIPISFSMMAERFVYMPSEGPIMAMAYGLSILYQKMHSGNRILGARWLAGAILLVLLVFSVKDVLRNQIYRDDFSFFSTAVTDSPGSAPSHNALGEQYFEKKGFSSAMAHYDEAIRIDPSYAEAWMGKALTMVAMKDQAAARFMAEKAISLKPKQATIRFSAGNIFRHGGDWSRAISEWEKAIELYPRYSAAYNHLGNTYEMRGERVKARAMYDRALEADPYNAESHYNMATHIEAYGDNAQARYHFHRFIELAGPEYRDIVQEIKKRYP